MKFGKPKTALLIISLELTACGSVLPDFPEVWQCQLNGTPRAFYCENTKTKEHLKIPVTAPSMIGAQCLSPEDYKRSEAWVAAVKLIAQQRCK